MKAATELRLAILGAGGLGKGMMQRVEQTPGFKTVALVDSTGYVWDEDGVDCAALLPLKSLNSYPNAIGSHQAILDLFTVHADDIDVVFVALPNLPVDFIPSIAEQLAEKTTFKGVIVDALKRSRAVELMLALHDVLAQNHILYITGAGATPGFLSTVAAVAAQSFVSVDHIDIRFGVGIANWEAYRATIREDFIHLPGFDADRVAAMSDADIEAELNQRNGLIELVNMEHADDIMLERAGICRRDQVTVGGLVDTRNAAKPIQTTVTITGKTVAGQTASHVLTLDNATTMVDNVCGPALGFLRQGVELHHTQALSGVLTSVDLMPKGHVTTSTAPNRQTVSA
ncbi:MAG: saccharopine dehydrogenase-like oxidoreductase [Cyanobacteria bacterium HKST-UBA04]|nr:saccharopine dehydrogenase-like oxidoreductase [Cyanobacteria bacterium HKST-UBA04]